MKWLHHVPMGIKFLLVLAFPLAAVLFLAGNGAWERWQLTREMDRVESLALVARDAGDLVHAMQAERGLSASFLNSGDEAFLNNLLAQRRQVDAEWDKLASRIDTLDTDIITKIDGALNLASDMHGLRQRVDESQLDANGAIEAYSVLNNELLDTVALLMHLTDQGQIVERVAGYFSLLKDKDLVGVERAVLTSVFAADEFTESLFQRLLMLMGSEAAYADAFDALAVQEHRERYADYMTNPLVGEVLAMREMAIERSAQGGFGVDPVEWFDLQTRRIGLLKEIEDGMAADLIATSQILRSDARRSLTGYLLGAVVIIGLAISLTWWITRSIVSPLRRTLHTIASSQGDLTQRLEVLGSDELAQLNTAYNKASDGTERMVGSIKRNAQSISTASGEIAMGNQDLAQRTEEQSSSLVETATSLEQISSTVKQTADNAEHARMLASDLDTQARDAGRVAEEASQAMGDIDKANQSVTAIVAAIDEIAFQTNLLALNASVEAARAGEHGRGFAVVAAEVRKLAQRCANEAGEIRKLVATSVDKVGQGWRLVDESGRQLENIAEGMSRMSAYVSDIANAALEQSTGVEQISQAMSQLDEVTQQNAALVEQAAAASKSLDDQAEEMADLVGRFKVNDDNPAPHRHHNGLAIGYR